MDIRVPGMEPRGWGRLALMFGWRRLITVAIAALVIWLPLRLAWESDRHVLLVRLIIVGLWAMLAFGFWEQWPRRLPRWIARWVLQVAAVGLTMIPAWIMIYALSVPDGGSPLRADNKRLESMAFMIFLGILIGPWVALGALVRQKEALARHQALSFALERSELERSAADARLHLMQAQVQPHFLFNTLANVRALVEAGSPRALAVLDSLIAYLRAAVPRLTRAGGTLGDELALVRAYLDIMQMRMPDRLTFTITAPPESLSIACPPMSILTLVENAVRHGIDPAEEGGDIAVTARIEGDICHVQVTDTGLGLRPGTGGLGTGLSTLRQRLALAFGDKASLNLEEPMQGGVSARLSFPARPVTV